MRPYLILSLLLAATATACGGGRLDEAPPDANVAEAADRTAEAGSARIALVGTIVGGPVDGASFTGEGEFAGERGRMSMDLSELAAASAGAFEGKMDVVFDARAVYVRMPGELADQFLEGKPWVKVDVEDAEKDDFLAFSKGDPTRLLRELSAEADFAEIGVEEVRGADTTHFRGTLDADKVDVWVGDDGLLRRVRFEGPLPAGEGSTETMTMEFFDFGAEIDIDLPPADQVAEFGADSLQGGSD
jgi:hypothetical protein